MNQIIKPGFGIKDCYIGMHGSQFLEKFGGEISNEYIKNKELGFELYIENNRIKVIFFYYISKFYNKFPGSVERGINHKSKIEDVIKSFGKPEHRGESYVSAHGPMPGAEEIFLSYRSQGILFTFYDYYLADVRVNQK